LFPFGYSPRLERIDTVDLRPHKACRIKLLGTLDQSRHNREIRVSESTIPVSKITPIGGSVISPKHEHTSSKQTSQKKIEANRRNALHSTGPKTERGKRTVSRNAVKHGLLAREVVIAQGNGAENAEEFAELLTALRDDYLPVGISEELLVEEIATCYWRRARVLRFEMGETRKHLDDAAMSYELQRLDEAHLNVSLLRVLKLE
jgi:hypothetical protein